MRIRNLKTTWLIGGIIVLAMVAASTSIAGTAIPRLYRMKGKIIAIDSQARTVVVNVPMTRSEIFTATGPLAKDARLLQEQKKVALNDFKVGEWVTVEWAPTPQGHLIKELELMKKR